MPILQPMEQNQAEMSFIPPTMSNLGMDPLFNPLHLFQQGSPPPVLVPTRLMESSNQGPTNVASTSQVPSIIPLPQIVQLQNANS
ncbi:hypothetical protein KY290_021794 [Solanum tuberosum]|uniref:Uncharacterized protein n=1 Tax=Solanum tuberosum TaxID=4113 RepID=A0ABQ7V4K4_SOLTU|nr:hypothetical protein KY289_020959 [Solanum tuberosum]KAH0693586.1 hypothetical protein KY285_020683 [Solanum tuberosum]KAH0758301.1 hypothetical protein KY290_021794 [Solanum tuberosum]